MKQSRIVSSSGLLIEEASPAVDDGRYPLKRIVGERLAVEATVFRDGHDLIRVSLKWRKEGVDRFLETPMTLTNPGLDRWRGEFPMEEAGRYFFTIEAWTDRFTSWAIDFRKRVEGGQKEIASEILEGLKLIEEAARSAQGEEKKFLKDFQERLPKLSADPPAALGLVSGEKINQIMLRLQNRSDRTTLEQEREVIADRPRAGFGAWYELFVRSQGTVPGQGGTFQDAQRRLEDIERMGFDVVYLAPIHPIGRTNRKGKNNSVRCEKGDPGSPWAIGSGAGGHDAVEPALGTLSDFDRFVEAARGRGMEVALDFAIQASPDHPWVRKHPDWFYLRPDGTIKYAENPPKKYEDIYPLNFETGDRQRLWEEMRRILLFWIDHGVRIFRVDNPHTKPIPFWRWLIDEIRSKHPDVIFLSEAFTRPQMMKTLAKAGFTQSYSYFTWRNTASELRDYLTELTKGPMKEYFRPNFFVNTPDILHEYLQRGGRPAFQIRLALAATLSPSYGIYSGFELCENEAMGGREEYIDSEKYEIKVRDWDRKGNIKEFISKINAIRRENSSLQTMEGLTFFESDNEKILFYGKATADRSNVILVVVNLDPFQAHHAMVTVPLGEIGVLPGSSFTVRDLLTDEQFTWTDRNYVRLDPAVRPVHILKVEKTG